MVHRVKVLVSKAGLDGHDIGALTVSRALRDAGFEVVYLGRFQTPERIVSAAVQEQVDVIGLSILSGEQLTFVPRLIRLLKENRLDDVLIIVGGVFPEEDVFALKQIGVDAVFRGTFAADAVKYIADLAGTKVRQRKLAIKESSARELGKGVSKNSKK